MHDQNDNCVELKPGSCARDLRRGNDTMSRPKHRMGELERRIVQGILVICICIVTVIAIQNLNVPSPTFVTESASEYFESPREVREAMRECFYKSNGEGSVTIKRLEDGGTWEVTCHE